MNGNTSTHIVNLTHIAARLAELRSVERAGELVCATALDVLGADGASALLSDGRGCYFTRYAAHLPCRAPFETGSSSPGSLELSASGLALCKNCPIIIPDVANDRRTPAALYGPLRVKSLVAVPVRSVELAVPLGALECHFRERHSASAEEVQLLQLLAGVAALGLRLIHLRTRMSFHKRGRATDLEALSRYFLRAAPARQKAEAEARRLALTDELTGLYNRRGLFARGATLLKDGRSRGRPVYILYADVDGLKAVNDCQGHEAGDRFIQAAAHILSSSLRADDLIARMGGDEFCAVLPGGNGDVSALPERLGRLCNAEPTRGVPSLSIGLVRDDEEPTTDLQSLIQRADHVMYVLKRWRKERRFAPDPAVRTEPTQTPVPSSEQEPAENPDRNPTTSS